jgi:thiol-disulfide isomerase/thioredoxin
VVGSTRHFTLGWAAVAVLFAVAVVLFVRGMYGVESVDEPSMVGVAAVGKALPDVRVRDLAGNAVSLRSFVGKPLWIDFFETWCPPCRAETPDIEQRYDADRSVGLIVIGVDIEEGPAQVAAFRKAFGTRYPMAIDDGAAVQAFEVQTIPMAVFVDASGIVRGIRIGQMDGPTMDDELRRILRSR